MISILNRKVEKGHVSDYLREAKFTTGELNLIVAGCGTGKTYWVATHMLNQFDGVLPSEVLFVTSRSMIVDQQAATGRVTKYDKRDTKIVRYWNNECDDDSVIRGSGIQIMTYDKIIDILKKKNSPGLSTLGRVKIFVLDECHTLFCDEFITGIDMLRIWIKTKIDEGSQYFIGMTATPKIIYADKDWGVGIRELVEESIIVNYTAKQLVCTDFRTVPAFIMSSLCSGKTIIMCPTVADCYKLQDKLPNSAVMVSRSNKAESTKEMEEIRNHIAKHETLPDYFTYVPHHKYTPDAHLKKRERRRLSVLITTSTMREGINLKQESGVRNVVCCFGDELHISQFVGRCRFNIDKLIIAQTYIRSDNIHQNSYIAQQRKLFAAYMRNKASYLWFYYISHLIDHSIYETWRFTPSDLEFQFIDYINQTWLVPPGADAETERSKWIYREEDKAEIVKRAIRHAVYGGPENRVTFLNVIRYMSEKMGYNIQAARGVVNGRREHYRLIVSFSETEYEQYQTGRKQMESATEYDESEDINALC